MKKLISFFGVARIELERGFDHIYRQLTGLPQIKRSMITPQLFLGGQYNFRGFARLKELGITAIVNMRISSIHKEASIEGFKYLHIPTPDQTAPTLEELQRGSKFIQEEIDRGGKVYIHCRAGEGRGPTMIIAYLITTGITYDDAFAQVKKVRTFIKPTKVQIERLKEFEESVKSSR